MCSIDNVILKYIPVDSKCRINESKNIMLRAKEKESLIKGIEMVLSVDLDWIELAPDMSVCRSCKETIYSTQYLLSVKINGQSIEQNRPVKLCNSCYNAVK